MTDLVFEMTGIDLETTTKEDLQKNTTDSAVSPIDFAPRLEDRALSVIRFTPEAEPPSPTPSPEMEIPEHISPDIKEVSSYFQQIKMLLSSTPNFIK